MPVYKLSIAGLDKPRIVRADTAAQARDHVVTTETIKSDDLADLIEEGVTIERAAKKAAEPDAAAGEEGEQKQPGLAADEAAKL